MPREGSVGLTSTFDPPYNTHRMPREGSVGLTSTFDPPYTDAPRSP
jgi:hypothetical protein